MISRHYNQVLYCLGKVQEAPANPDIQAHIPRSSWEGVRRSALLHGSEMWAPTASDLQRLRRNDRSMIRWICGIMPKDEITIDLCTRLEIQEVTAALSALDGMGTSSDLHPV